MYPGIEPSNPMGDSLMPMMKGLRLAKYVKDVYKSNAGIYTRDMLLKLEEDLSSTEPSQLIKISCMNGGFLTAVRPSMEYNIKVKMLDINEMTERARTAFTSGFLKDEVYHFTEEQRTTITCPITISTVLRDAKKHDLRELEAAWNRGWLSWGKSPVHKALLQALKTLGPKMPEISKVLCLGLGPLGGDLSSAKKPGDGQANYRNITQHMFAATLTKTLSSRLKRRIPLMVSDPEYTENDKKILWINEKMKVIEGSGARALAEIDSKTLVVCFNPSIALKQVVSDFAKPAAMIWGQTVSTHKKRQRRGSRTCRLGDYYDEFVIAKEPIRFGKINMCIRKQIIDDLAIAIETELELPNTNGMAKHGWGNTHMDDMDGVVIVDYEPEDEWVFLD
ncbi:unnamed protein product [Clonostachys solani]|uniref:SRR1-like domain-containing protein n=1 Tax=Clonostachys solani TaxID=160281 RepID=A0A9P0ERT7_9HYPO|nr:unnamed protein product [Clonostachys solani]